LTCSCGGKSSCAAASGVLCSSKSIQRTEGEKKIAKVAEKNTIQRLRPSSGGCASPRHLGSIAVDFDGSDREAGRFASNARQLWSCTVGRLTDPRFAGRRTVRRSGAVEKNRTAGTKVYHVP
jgi:hypothetical protein